MIAGQGEYEIVLQVQFTFGCRQDDSRWRDFLHGRVEVRGDFAVLDAIFDVRFYPILHVLMNRRTAVNQRHACPVPP